MSEEFPVRTHTSVPKVLDSNKNYSMHKKKSQAAGGWCRPPLTLRPNFNCKKGCYCGWRVAADLTPRFQMLKRVVLWRWVLLFAPAGIFVDKNSQDKKASP